MKNDFPLTNLASKADWDKPIEFPKPEIRPDIPVKQEPATPGKLPEPPEIIPAERPETDMPIKEIPGTNE